MNRAIHSAAAAPSVSNYAQAIETPAGARWLHISGQIGARADGTLELRLEEQVEAAWANVIALLEAAEMGPGDIVELLVCLPERRAIPVFREIRNRVLGTHEPASTMLICALAHPDWLVEISVRAAKCD